LIAQEAKYHLNCLTSFYYKAESLQKEIKTDSKLSQANGIALAEIVSLIEEAHSVSDNSVPVFKLSDLVKMYSARVNHNEQALSPQINSTHLKERILARVPYLEAHRQGKEIFLVHKKDIGNIIKGSSSYDDEGMYLTNAAKIVRRDILKAQSTGTPFQGEFSRQQAKSSIPQTLVSLIGLILGGVSCIKEDIDPVESDKVKNLSELIMFNVSESKNALLKNASYVKTRETQLPVYIGLLIHAETRKKSIIDKFHALGISISYKRLMEISTNIGNYVSDCYESEGVVCPLNMKKRVFTTAAVDNIDHNPSSVTAKGSFHGTGISLFQHFDEDSIGEDR